MILNVNGETRYFDKNGFEITDGCDIRFPDGRVERVYRTTDGLLGIDATNPAWIQNGRAEPCEYGVYPLATGDTNDVEVVGAVRPTNRTEIFKVNFPATAESYRSGNGEGMWVYVDALTYDHYRHDVAGGLYVGTLANDSVYYPGELVCGSEVFFEMRGTNRPVAVWEGFLSSLKGGGKERFFKNPLSGGWE